MKHDYTQSPFVQSALSDFFKTHILPDQLMEDH